MKKKIFSTFDYLKTDIWLTPVQELSRAKAFYVKPLKVILLAFRGFQEDRCSEKASALTFYSLLSVVPIVAMIFAIAKGFGFHKKLQAQLLEKFAGQEKVLLKIYEFSDSMLEKTKGGIIAGIGVAFLLWSVIKVLGNIEQSFNDIWKVEKQRSFARKCSDYLSVMLIGPVIFLMAGSLTVTMASQVKFIAMKVAHLGVPPAPILLLLRILPFVLIWTLFSFIYIYMPNTKVHLRSALFAGVVIGTTYEATQWVYITFQVGMARNNAIYGSFAALPLFLIWMQLSWFIVLLGAELSFAIQNVDTYGYPMDARKVSEFNKKLLSLLIARLVIRKFSEGAHPLTAPAIANTLGMPLRLVRHLLSELAASGIFTMTKTEEYEEDAYQPARDIHKISIRNVLETLERSGSVDLAFPRTEDFRAISDTLQTFGDTLEKSSANKLIIEL